MKKYIIVDGCFCDRVQIATCGMIMWDHPISNTRAIVLPGKQTSINTVEQVATVEGLKWALAKQYVSKEDEIVVITDSQAAHHKFIRMKTKRQKQLEKLNLEWVPKHPNDTPPGISSNVFRDFAFRNGLNAIIQLITEHDGTELGREIRIRHNKVDNHIRKVMRQHRKEMGQFVFNCDRGIPYQ